MSRVYPFFNYAALRYFNAAGASAERGGSRPAETSQVYHFPLIQATAVVNVSLDPLLTPEGATPESVGYCL